jgi:three-Cys-motif partner protein
VARHTKFGVEAEFFKKLREGSRIKQKIVTEYFVAYNRVMTPGQREKVGYADLFAGPGLYADDDATTQKSIPVLVCEQAIQNRVFRNKVHLWFNDGDRRNYQRLKAAIESTPGVDTLRYRPRIDNRVINARWDRVLSKLRVPTLVFLDPCGYKGLSLRLVASVLAGYGNDCIFFFNYSRVNMKLDLELMNRSLDEFFEPERARILRAEVRDRSASDREDLILATVKSSLEEVGAIPLVFRFKSDSGRTSHHLVYASKNQMACNMMKAILRSASSEVVEGVGSGEHDPRALQSSGKLFAGLYEVEERLLSAYSGRIIKFGDLLREEARIQYTESNYRDAILNLESEKRVIVDPPSAKRRFQAGGQKRTLSKEVTIHFSGGANHGD